MRPELADPGAASPRVEHRHRRLVAEQPRRCLDRPQLELIEAFEPPGRTLHPAGKRRAVEMDALAGQNLHLPVQRQIPGELRDHHVGHERRRRHAALDQARQHLRLHHAIGAAAAGIFGTDRAQHPQDRRDHVQHLADVLADLVQTRPGSTGTPVVSGSSTCSQRGRCLGSAPMLRLAFLRGVASRLRRRRIIVGRRRRCDAGLEIAQLERELLGDERRKPLRALPEDHLLERLHRHAQLLVLGVEREHHLGQSCGVGRESFGANRHDQTIHPRTLCSSKIRTSHPTTSRLLHRLW